MSEPEDYLKILIGVPGKFQVGQVASVQYEVICTYNSLERVSAPEDSLKVYNEAGKDVTDYSWWAVPGKYSVKVTTYAVCPGIGADKAPTLLQATDLTLSQSHAPVGLRSQDRDELIAALQNASPIDIKARDKSFDHRGAPHNASIINLAITSESSPSSIEADPELFANRAPSNITSAQILEANNAPIALTAVEKLGSSSSPTGVNAWDADSDDPRNASAHNLSFLDNPDGAPTNAQVIDLLLRVGPESISSFEILGSSHAPQVLEYAPELDSTHAVSGLEAISSPLATSGLAATPQPIATQGPTSINVADIDVDEDGVWASVDFDDNNENIGEVIAPVSNQAPTSISGIVDPTSSHGPTSISASELPPVLSWSGMPTNIRACPNYVASAINNSNFQTIVDSWFTDEAATASTYGHISCWDVSAVTDMSEAFKDRTTFNEDLSRWDVSSVTSMQAMFQGCHAYNPLVGHLRMDPSYDYTGNGGMHYGQAMRYWDVSNVTDFSFMFKDARAMDQILGDWDVSSATTMEGMFWGAWVFDGFHYQYTQYVQPITGQNNWASQDAGMKSWDVSNVTSFNRMFMDAYAFNGYIVDWDTSSVVDWWYMFSNPGHPQPAMSFNWDISGWDVSSASGGYQSVTQLQNTFSDGAQSSTWYSSEKPTFVAWY